MLQRYKFVQVSPISNWCGVMAVCITRVIGSLCTFSGGGGGDRGRVIVLQFDSIDLFVLVGADNLWSWTTLLSAVNK